MSEVIWNHLLDVSEEVAGIQSAVHHRAHGGAFSHPRFCPEVACVYAWNLVSIIENSRVSDVDSLGMNDRALFVKRNASERSFSILLNYAAWMQVAKLEVKALKARGIG